MQPEDLAHEVRVEVFLHLDGYDPERGRPTTWTRWRVRKVVMVILRQLQKNRRATPFSQIGSPSPWNKDFGETFEHDGRRRPAPVGSEIEREDDQAELRRVVGEAVADLPRAQRDAVAVVFGIGRDPATTCREGARVAGVSHQAVNQLARSGQRKLAADERLWRLAQSHGLAPAAR
ncbi:sigma-70 family RNA polymerase sigma factor [bacterium]|nr:sigma-70 family RNA polymerase sigma factor [bacterium]